MNNDELIQDSVVLIRISKLFDEMMTQEEMYEATRGVWKVGSRRESAKFAFTVANGEVKEVYEITSWLPAGTTPYKTRLDKDIQVKGRWEFVGHLASQEIRNSYIGKSVKQYLPRGSANPITYINC